MRAKVGPRRCRYFTRTTRRKCTRIDFSEYSRKPDEKNLFEPAEFTKSFGFFRIDPTVAGYCKYIYLITPDRSRRFNTTDPF